MATLEVHIKIVPDAGENVADLLADLAERLDGFEVTSAADPETLPDADSSEDIDAEATEENTLTVRPPGGWTDKRADKFVRLITPDCRLAIRFIAEHAPEAQVEDVISHLGLPDGTYLGGRMSSVGHAMNRMPKGMDWPIDRQRGTYFIDETVAETLLHALNRYAERHAA